MVSHPQQGAKSFFQQAGFLFKGFAPGRLVGEDFDAAHGHLSGGGG